MKITNKPFQHYWSLLHATFSSDHFQKSPRNCENAPFFQKGHNTHSTQDTSEHKACNDYFCSKLYDTEKRLFCLPHASRSFQSRDSQAESYVLVSCHIKSIFNIFKIRKLFSPLKIFFSEVERDGEEKRIWTQGDRLEENCHGSARLSEGWERRAVTDILKQIFVRGRPQIEKQCPWEKESEREEEKRKGGERENWEKRREAWVMKDQGKLESLEKQVSQVQNPQHLRETTNKQCQRVEWQTQHSLLQK